MPIINKRKNSFDGMKFLKITEPIVRTESKTNMATDNTNTSSISIISKS